MYKNSIFIWIGNISLFSSTFFFCRSYRSWKSQFTAKFPYLIHSDQGLKWAWDIKSDRWIWKQVEKRLNSIRAMPLLKNFSYFWFNLWIREVRKSVDKNSKKVALTNIPAPYKQQKMKYKLPNLSLIVQQSGKFYLYVLFLFWLKFDAIVTRLLSLIIA